MKKMLLTAAKRRHSEITTRLDRIIELLDHLRKDTRISESAVIAATEYYTNDELCQILRVSKRTLARYRQKKLISYYMINGKVYYKASELSAFLQKNGKV